MHTSTAARGPSRPLGLLLCQRHGSRHALRERAAARSTAAAATKKQTTGGGSNKTLAGPKRGGGNNNKNDDDDDTTKDGWRFFDASAYGRGWDVPWSGATTASGMALWVGSFAAVAFVLMPAAYAQLSGVPLRELDAAGQADFALWSEVAELALTAALLGGIASRCVVCVFVCFLCCLPPHTPIIMNTFNQTP